MRVVVMHRRNAALISLSPFITIHQLFLQNLSKTCKINGKTKGIACAKKSLQSTNTSVLSLTEKRTPMNLKIAICDDNEMDRAKLQSMLTSYYISNDINLSFDLFSSGKALFQQYTKSGDYQVVLLDIEMPEINGIQIAEAIRTKIDKHVIIIFISNYPQYMQQSFLVRPFYYVTKPFKLADIFDLMDKVVQEIESSHVIYSLISTEKGDVTINIKDILFIEATDSRNNLLSFHFYDHQLTAKGTILHWQEQLTEYNFYRCYRSILVNLLHIHYFDKGQIILDNGCCVPVSRKNEKELKALFLNTTIQLLNL